MLVAALSASGPVISAVIAATVGAVIAIRTINTNRAIARFRATLDMIERSESQDHYKNLSAAFREFRRGSSDVEKILRPVTPEDKEIRSNILDFLNHYELIAVGFHTDVLDRAFYAEFMRGTVVRDWRASRLLIGEMRKPDDSVNPTPNKIFEHFETLAKEWEWEIAHEDRLRRQGFSDPQIKRAIAFFRSQPTASRPHYGEPPKPH